jgi:flavin-dependent dehydrogenase
MLWKHMESYSDYITARQGFSMVDILKDESGNVIGIVGKSRTGLNENITADLVVGADGRFSIAAKKFGAKVIEERNEFTSGGFEAQWENVAPYAEGVSTEFCIYSSAKCYLDLFIPISQGHYYVVAYMRSQDVNRGDKSPQEYYIESLKRIPKAWQRLEGARQIGKLEAICPVENGYREPFGRGWALTGDAYHYKDPVDGQGIYDALLETKILAEAIAEWKGGTLTWEQAGALYKEKAWAATYPMFQSSVARVRRELHTTPPSFILNTLIKWMLNDPAYQTAFLRTLARASDPLKMPTMPTPGMIWRGILRSFQPSDKSKAKSALKVPQPQ